MNIRSTSKKSICLQYWFFPQKFHVLDPSIYENNRDISLDYKREGDESNDQIKWL